MKKFDIRYDELILVDSFEAKAEVIDGNNMFTRKPLSLAGLLTDDDTFQECTHRFPTCT